MTFRATKTYTHSNGLSACFRQFRAKSHCRFLHGYALEVRIEFEANDLDENGWVVDFGSLKPVKAILEDMYDHKTLVAEDDPNLEWYREGARMGLIDIRVLEGMGCEYFAFEIFRVVRDFLGKDQKRVWVAKVEVREHSGNSAVYLPK